MSSSLSRSTTDRRLKYGIGKPLTPPPKLIGTKIRNFRNKFIKGVGDRAI